MRVNPVRRRLLAALAVLGGGARATRAARDGPARVAILALDSREGIAARLRAFKAAMAKLGRREGADVEYVLHAAAGDPERLAPLAQRIAQQAPAVVLSDCALATLALRKTGAPTPIVMAACDDPLASRFVRSLEKPGSNATGLTAFLRDETPRLATWVAPLVPRGAPLAGIFNPGNATYRKHRAGFHKGALDTGLAPVYLDAVNAREVDEAFAAAAREKAAGIVVMNDALFLAERARFVRLAGKLGRPVLFPAREFVRAGGLMSFGPNLEESFRRAASFAHRILSGEAAAELAVEPPARYELALNRATAAAQGVKFPGVYARQAAYVAR